MADTYTTPTQTTGGRRSRGKAQQIIDTMTAIQGQLNIFFDAAGQVNATDLDLMPVLMVTHLAEKLRELTRVAR